MKLVDRVKALFNDNKYETIRKNLLTFETDRVELNTVKVKLVTHASHEYYNTMMVTLVYGEGEFDGNLVDIGITFITKEGNELKLIKLRNGKSPVTKQKVMYKLYYVEDILSKFIHHYTVTNGMLQTGYDEEFNTCELVPLDGISNCADSIISWQYSPQMTDHIPYARMMVTNIRNKRNKSRVIYTFSDEKTNPTMITSSMSSYRKLIDFISVIDNEVSRSIKLV